MSDYESLRAEGREEEWWDGHRTDLVSCDDCGADTERENTCAYCGRTVCDGCMLDSPDGRACEGCLGEDRERYAGIERLYDELDDVPDDVEREAARVFDDLYGLAGEDAQPLLEELERLVAKAA